MEVAFLVLFPEKFMKTFFSIWRQSAFLKTTNGFAEVQVISPAWEFEGEEPSCTLRLRRRNRSGREISPPATNLRSWIAAIQGVLHDPLFRNAKFRQTPSFSAFCRWKKFFLLNTLKYRSLTAEYRKLLLCVCICSNGRYVFHQRTGRCRCLRTLQKSR